ncbi:WecB/TagA/CpsF family glycosyltransferase [Thermoleophilia bacterium SCSIO 60948]|nr:WecB/TagA/CpsF family glycosyltransferase [Thermoleophilia bacterium SCSIO 60948]
MLARSTPDTARLLLQHRTAGTQVQTSLNAAKVVRARDDRELRQAMASSDVISADGQSIVWAARLLGGRLPTRVPGIDLFEELLAQLDKQGGRAFLLGAREEVSEKAALELSKRYPNVGLSRQHGYFDPSDAAGIVANIRAFGPDALFVAMGTPDKELWIHRYGRSTEAGVVMGVGGSLDVVAGEVRRAPRWLQVLGLEWFFRLAQEPRRLLRRYASTNTAFLWMVLCARLRRGSPPQT